MVKDPEGSTRKLLHLIKEKLPAKYVNQQTKSTYKNLVALLPAKDKPAKKEVDRKLGSG